MTKALLHVKGKCSWFGGPDDMGVDADEGLAFLYDVNDKPVLFLPEQPPSTTGLARRLNPNMPYIACRWDYNKTPKTMLADQKSVALVISGGFMFYAIPADWGPHGDTERVADLSPGLMDALRIETDDTVEVIYPAPKIPRKSGFMSYALPAETCPRQDTSEEEAMSIAAPRTPEEIKMAERRYPSAEG